MSEDNAPDDAVELEGEEDIIRGADLADEAPLSAQVTVEHVIRGVLHQREQEGRKLSISYL